MKENKEWILITSGAATGRCFLKAAIPLNFESVWKNHLKILLKFLKSSK